MSSSDYKNVQILVSALLHKIAADMSANKQVRIHEHAVRVTTYDTQFSQSLSNVSRIFTLIWPHFAPKRLRRLMCCLR